VNHRVQSNQTALWYLARIRDWMISHPAEVLRMTISRHGDDSYPYTPPQALHSFFANFTALFDGMLVNRTSHPASTTSIKALVRSGQRMLTTLADYTNMTSGGSALVNDESLQTQWCGSVQLSGLNASFQASIASCFSPTDTSYLKQVGVGLDPPTAVYVTAGEIFFDPLKVLNDTLTRRCAKEIGFSALSGKWCPVSIKEYNWLEAYWAQWLLEEATQKGLVFPSGVFVNDVGAAGTLQIGDGKGYALVDTLLLATVRRACHGAAPEVAPACSATEAALQQRRALHPIQVWQDDDRGRALVPPT